MRKLVLCVLGMMIVVILLSCSATDKLHKDKIPPLKPILIPHLGMVGDLVDDIELTDDNNGTDATSDGDRIRLMWSWQEPMDRDLHIVRIFRFDTNKDGLPVEIGNTSWRNNSFIDPMNPNVSGFAARDVEWSYFIRAVDQAGNFTDSDTVRFMLVDKPILTNPLFETIKRSELRDIANAFRWRRPSSVLYSRFRVLIFESGTNRVVWKSDELNITEEIDYQRLYNGDLLPVGEYYWRVDARGLMDSEGYYNSGSKSNTWSFRIIE